MATGQYFSRLDRALRVDTLPAVDGRLSATIEFTLEDPASGETRRIAPEFQLMGPGDVTRLASGAILRRHPSPGTGDAEETKYALVEFAAMDLPWRYTPESPAGAKLRPWLVLVVGARGAEGISPRPDGTVRIGLEAQAAHPLASSWAWAHVHRVGTFERSRLLSPAELAPETSYLAAVVPAFTADGTDAWSGTRAVVLPCYDQWEFRTGPAGDFPSLARLLRKADLAELEQRGGRPFGRAEVAYHPRSGDPTVVLSAAGALRVPVENPPDPADAPPPASVAADVAALQTPISSPEGRDVITAPDYAGDFRLLDAAPAAGGWPVQLSEDPRVRGAAGLGAWTAIAWQDRIADAASVKLGDAAIAAERIRALALGVMASRSLWRRRVPEDPVHALAVLAPAFGRLPVSDAGSARTVLDAILLRHAATGGPQSPQFAPALFSSAGRRALRAGPARSALAAEGKTGLLPLVVAASGCPDATDPPDVFENRDPDPAADPLSAAKDAIYAATDHPDLAARVVDRLLGDGILDPAWLAAALKALRPGPDGRVDEHELNRVLDTRDHPPLDEPDGDWEEAPDEFAPDCAPVDLVGFGKAVMSGIDPSVDEPPAARRVFATLPGVRSMRPLEVEPELDIPLWSFLSSSSPDWMLPGVGDLAEHEVIGVETNPLFVQALLVGANSQTTGELRWRNVPLRPRSSPLRRFWQRAAGVPPTGGPDDVYDIRPLRFWPDGTPLGDAALTPTARGSEAVAVFKSPIFRRYPSTVVYLYDARPTVGDQPDWSNPPAENVTLEKPKRVDVTFAGRIGPEVTFFGFPVPASALAHHWVVLEEPPAGYRFKAAPEAGIRDINGVPDAENHSADFAHRRFALPVRVLIGPLA